MRRRRHNNNVRATSTATTTVRPARPGSTSPPRRLGPRKSPKPPRKPPRSTARGRHRSRRSVCWRRAVVVVVVPVALLLVWRAFVLAWRPVRPVASPATHTAPRSFYRTQELFCDNPWALLISCILLNQTTRAQVAIPLPSYTLSAARCTCCARSMRMPRNKRRASTWQVDPVLHALLTKYPQPAALAAADLTHLEDILRQLGLHKRCACCCCGGCACSGVPTRCNSMM